MLSSLTSLVLTLMVTSGGWGDHLPTALDRSRASGKPVLVYVLDVF